MSEKKKNYIKSQLESCKRRLDYCELAYTKQDYAYVVRECQTIVEICSKMLLARFGYIVPEKHDIRRELEEEKELFSQKFQSNIKFIKELSRDLRRERELSLYGDARDYVPPSDLYSKEDTIDYLNDTKRYYKLCTDELKDYLYPKEKIEKESQNNKDKSDISKNTKNNNDNSKAKQK